MNTYRNAHQYTNANFKKKYSEACIEALKAVDDFHYNMAELEYKIYFPLTKAGKHKRIDLVNSLSVVDKVFEDCLVANGNIEDDTISQIKRVSMTYGPTEEEGYIRVMIREVLHVD